MSARLILAIVSTLLEEAALVVIVLWGLPEIDVHIPLWGLIALMVVWAVSSIIMYRIGSGTLRKKPVIGLPTMVGSKGKAVSPLDPEGIVTVKGELWQAKSEDEKIGTGEQIIVVGQDGLRLIVRKGNIGDSKGVSST